MKTATLILAGVGAGIVAGCYLEKGGKSSDPGQVTGRQYVNEQSLQPAALPYKQTRIIMGGLEVPAEMSRKVEGKQVTFEITAKGEVLEQEHYENDDTGFRFASLSDESFNPPIPIIRYPFTVGEKWEWSGTAGLGQNIKQATAVVTSTQETLNLVTGVADCVRVTADLEVATGGPGKSKRPLKFWIEPGKGIVKREFAYSSTREPRPKTSSEP